MITQTELWVEQASQKLKFQDFDFENKITNMDLKFKKFELPDFEIVD